MREGWLAQQCAHAKIELEENERALRIAERRAAKRKEEWDRMNPLGAEIPESPDWAID